MEIVPILWLMSPPHPVLWRLVAVLAGLVVTVSLLPATSYAASGWSLRDRFAREATYALDRDVNPWHIEHVRELQLRLRFLGLFERRISGVDGVATQRAVREFQAAHGLPKSNTATHATWAALIEATIRGRSFIPRGCHAAGWHACYDRRRHQLTLFHNGVLHNAWLVRGGARDTPTRVGRFVVFRRDKVHVSSLPGHDPMPYAQFFSGGEAIHGSRRMMNPFQGHSHGCINMYVEDARQLWRLTVRHRLVVHVYGRWS